MSHLHFYFTKLIIRLFQKFKIQIKCDEAIYKVVRPMHKNEYEISIIEKEIGPDEFVCKLKLIHQKPVIQEFDAKVAEMRKNLETIEDGIFDPLWASYRLRVCIVILKICWHFSIRHF
jgi:hypothetical protein